MSITSGGCGERRPGPLLFNAPELPTCSAPCPSVENHLLGNMLALHQIAHLPVSYPSYPEQNGNLCNKGPQVKGGGEGSHSLDGQLCRAIPAAGSELEENLVHIQKQMKNSHKTTVQTVDS